MNDAPLSINVLPTTETDYQSAIDECIRQMETMGQQILNDRQEIDRLKTETRGIIDQLKVV